MSKKKVLLRGVFINRDTNGEGVLKVGTTLIRVSTVMGILYISENEYIYNDHYRRFMDKKIFISKLKKLGYEIVFEVEGNTLSKTKKSDPTLIRIVAKYIG